MYLRTCAAARPFDIRDADYREQVHSEIDRCQNREKNLSSTESGINES